MSSPILNINEEFYIQDKEEEEVGIDNLPWHVSRHIVSQRFHRGAESPKDYVPKNQADLEEICKMLKEVNQDYNENRKE